MRIDRDTFFTALGGEDAAALLTDEQRADALDDYLIAQLNAPEYPQHLAAYNKSMAGDATTRKGTGFLFGDGQNVIAELAPMPQKPTLVDFLQRRCTMPNVRHLLQSAESARRIGATEEQILACLLHDIGQVLVRADHGWWTAQMVEPYVSDKVAFAIRYHQSLRFFPDESVGYAYPEHYVHLYGKDYVPEPYIFQAAEFARQHKWYMEARMVTVHDLYAWDPDASVSLDPFIDIIGRNFKQPEEGLGYDNSPTAHMWRTMIFPDHPL